MIYDSEGLPQKLQAKRPLQKTHINATQAKRPASLARHATKYNTPLRCVKRKQRNFGTPLSFLLTNV